MADPLEDLEALEAEEQAEDNSESQPEEAEPELILGKFKSQEELERSYAEAERALTQARQEAAAKDRMLKQYEQTIETTTRPQEQQFLPDGTPYYSDEQLQAWMQQAMDMADGAALQQVMALQTRRDSYMAQMSVTEQNEARIAAQEEWRRDQQAEATLSEIKRLVGDEVLDRNKDELAGALNSFGSAFDRATPQETAREVARYIRGLEAERESQKSRTRDPRTGKYVAEERPVHVEGGSSPQPPGTEEPQEDDDIRELLAYREGTDLFGRR